MSQTQSAKRKLETRELESLVPFPTQDLVFPPCPEGEDDALADDIRRRGLQEPIHVLPPNAAGLPPNTILYGHRRCAALLRNGTKTAKVIVRYDLASTNEAKIELLFLDDNDKRRQLSKLGKARIALRRYEIERRREPGELHEREERDARDRVGQAIGMSGRNLQRYMNILKAPQSIQQAFEDGHLALKEAERITRLPAATQDEIDEKLQNGIRVKKVVAMYLGKPRPQAHNRGTAVRRFIAGLQKSLGELEGFDLMDIQMTPKNGELKMLHEANRSCVEIIRALKRTRKEKDELLRQVRRNRSE